MLPHFFRVIGSDRCLTRAQVEQATEPHPLLPEAWEIYQDHFQGFTGATVDPLFHRLSHPATRVASLQLEPDAAVIVVGTGPSLRPSVAGLKRLQGRARIITSPRGAEALLPHGIVPDVVLVEHQTALDAHHSVRHLGDCPRNVLASCPLVAADWRTPAALLKGVAADALFVPSSSSTWGLWPATAVALAVEAGVSRIALLGVDLGSAGAPDPVHAPLAAVLALLARLAPIVALDCGAGGAAKRGWMKASIDEAAGAIVTGRCRLQAQVAPSIDDRLCDARAALMRQAYLVERARALLAAASAAAGGAARSGAPHASGRPEGRPLRDDGAIAQRDDATIAQRDDATIELDEGAVELMAWRDDRDVRLFVQECLGLSFLPRLWRLGLDPSLGRARWRPVMLATHELVRQADALAAATSTARAA